MTISKVLCVDDVPADLSSLEAILAGDGLVVTTAHNGRDAIAKAMADRPDAIFMDVNIPEPDGFAAMREIKRDPVGKEIPVVLVTSPHQKADRLWAEMQGAAGLISKPYTAEQVRAQLQGLEH